VGENTYKTEPPGDLQVSATLYVRNLTPYLEDDKEYGEELRKNLLQGVGLMWSNSQA